MKLNAWGSSVIRKELVTWKAAGRFLLAFFTMLGFVSAILTVLGWFGIDAGKQLPFSIHPGSAVSILAGVALAYAARSSWPMWRCSATLHRRECTVSVELNDVFATRDAVVIPVTSTLDVDCDKVIGPDSVLGAFVARYYQRWQDLESQIGDALASRTDLSSSTQSCWGAPEYPLGTCLKVDAKGRTFFLLVASKRNESGQAEVLPNELWEALAGFFEFLKVRGNYMGGLRMPVFGKGYGRLKLTTEDVVRETIALFVSACSDKRLLSSLTVVIFPKNNREHPVDMRRIHAYLTDQCELPVWSSG
ncbi:MAG: hypothetical protein KJZ62_06365 [Fimbriimonadaceae bacterium]|nr:hypothetical protein [Fimbriimonadaceae bacterium]QOJ12482.1 MAG: hypothetical protein HRU74_10640 [Chthonomonadaceae bacterium]